MHIKLVRPLILFLEFEKNASNFFWFGSPHCPPWSHGKNGEHNSGREWVISQSTIAKKNQMNTTFKKQQQIKKKSIWNSDPHISNILTHPLSFNGTDSGMKGSVYTMSALLLFMLDLVPYALRPPHTKQPLIYLQPLWGVGIRLKEHIIDSMDIFSGSLWPR